MEVNFMIEYLCTFAIKSPVWLAARRSRAELQPWARLCHDRHCPGG